MTLWIEQSRRRTRSTSGSWRVKDFAEAKERPRCFSTQKRAVTAPGARRRLHLQRDEERAREDHGEDEAVVRHQGSGDDG